MNWNFSHFLAVLAIAAPAHGATTGKDAGAGSWILTSKSANESISTTLNLQIRDGEVSGTSGPLDADGFSSLSFEGRQGSGQTLELGAMANNKPIGHLTLKIIGNSVTGSGTLYGVPVSIAGVRPKSVVMQPTVHDFSPTSYALRFSPRIAPVLHISPGDKVRTTTVDNGGRDQSLRPAGMPGNPLTGPFYVEGAMPGDTLVVHLDRVEVNRDTAQMYSGQLDRRAIQDAGAQKPTPDWGSTWVLDRAKGTARLANPGAHLAGLELPIKPMIGTIGVAPPLNQELYAGDLGFHGGNLDYNRLTTGATVYLPVFEAGAFLALGDGHARQGDGEISGQGLETSLSVDFTVDLIKGKSLGQVWSEDADYVMVSGIEGSLDTALQLATTGMARWLKERYDLNDSEIAALLSSAIEYDIAEIVDPRPHVVAKLSKKTLAMIHKP